MRTLSAAQGCTGLIKPPSWKVLLLALIPFAAMCFSVALWDRVQPTIFGIPFNLFWLICWIVLTTLCLWGAYRLEAKASRHKDAGGSR
jgi:hypothetical protein